MRIWYPLLLAPILALADQGISYATAGWACANQNVTVMHAIHGVFFIACAAGMPLAWGMHRASAHAGADERMRVRHFLAFVGFLSAALATAVVGAMWFPNWLLSPCFG